MKSPPGWLLFLALAVSLLEPGAAATAPAPRLESDVLRIDRSLKDAAITVLDKRIALNWRQKVQPDRTLFDGIKRLG